MTSATFQPLAHLSILALLLTLLFSSHAAPPTRLADAVIHGLHPTAVDSNRWSTNSTFVIDSQLYLRHLDLTPAGGALSSAPYPWFNVSDYRLQDLAVNARGQVWLYSYSLSNSSFHYLTLLDPAHHNTVLINLSYAAFTPPILPKAHTSFLSLDLQDRLYVATQTDEGAVCHQFTFDGRPDGQFGFQLQSDEALLGFDVDVHILYALVYPRDPQSSDPSIRRYTQDGRLLSSEMAQLGFPTWPSDFRVIDDVAFFPVSRVGPASSLWLWTWNIATQQPMGKVVTQLSEVYFGWIAVDSNNSVLACSEGYGQCELVPGITNSSHVLYTDEQSRLFEPLDVHYIPHSQTLVVASDTPAEGRVVLVHPRQGQVEYSFFGPAWPYRVEDEYVAVDQRTSWVYLLHYWYSGVRQGAFVQVFDEEAAFVRQFNVSVDASWQNVAMVVDPVHETLILSALDDRQSLRYHLNGTFLDRIGCYQATYGFSWALVNNRSVLVCPVTDSRLLQLRDATDCSVLATVETAPYQPVLAETDGSGGWWVAGDYSPSCFSCVVHFDSAGQVVEVLVQPQGFSVGYRTPIGLAVSPDGSVWMVTFDQSFLYQWLSPNAVAVGSSSSSSAGSAAVSSSSSSSSSAWAAATSNLFSSSSSSSSSSAPSVWSSTSSSLALSSTAASCASCCPAAVEGWSTPAVIALAFGFAVIGAVLALLIDLAVRVCGRRKVAAARSSGSDELQSPMLAHVGDRSR